MDPNADVDDQGRTLLIPPILGAPLISRNGQSHWPADDGYIHADLSQVASLVVQGCTTKADHEAFLNDPHGATVEEGADDGTDVHTVRKPKRS